MYPLSALLIPLPVRTFTTEEITGSTNETAKGASKGRTNLPFWNIFFRALLF